MIEFVNKIDQELNKSINLLSGGIDQLKEAIDDLGELLKNQKVPGTSETERPPDQRNYVMDPPKGDQQVRNEASENKDLS